MYYIDIKSNAVMAMLIIIMFYQKESSWSSGGTLPSIIRVLGTSPQHDLRV